MTHFPDSDGPSHVISSTTLAFLLAFVNSAWPVGFRLLSLYGRIGVI